MDMQVFSKKKQNTKPQKPRNSKARALLILAGVLNTSFKLMPVSVDMKNSQLITRAGREVVI